jgi:serine/threonine-protein kinase
MSAPASAQTVPEPPTLSPGHLVGGRYRLVRRIARGGMAEVWEADDVVLSRPVAVKALLPRLAADEGFVARFRREAVAAARLAHPNIVSIYDTFSEPDCEAIVMELVRAGTLREALDDGSPLPMATAVDIAIQVAAALEHAHARGLVHRDVKPANILRGGDGRILVTDFGIAKAFEEAALDPGAPRPGTVAGGDDDDTPPSRLAAGRDATSVGDVVGTAKYQAPEQLHGLPADPRTDVYALGVVLYEMLCGRPPFMGATPAATAAAVLRDHPLRPRQLRAGIPRQLEAVTMKALARDPADRYPSAAAFQAALGALRPDPFPFEADATADVEAPPAAARVDRQRSWLVPGALIVLVALAVGIAGFLVTKSPGRPATAAPPQPAAVKIDSAAAFDPLGDHQENDAQAALAIDGDPATSWHSQTYQSAGFGGLKSGVGLVLRLPATAPLGTLTLTSPTTNWTASIYLGSEPATDLAGWGQPVATVTAAQTATGAPVAVALGGRQSQSILVWVTSLGDPAGGGYRFDLAEASLQG